MLMVSVVFPLTRVGTTLEFLGLYVALSILALFTIGWAWLLFELVRSSRLKASSPAEDGGQT